MTIQADFEDDGGGQFATNKGWADFGAWADELDETDFPLIVHLRDYGWSGDVSGLSAELAEAVEAMPPKAEGLDSVIRSLIALCDENERSETVFITDGMGKDDDAEPS